MIWLAAIWKALRAIPWQAWLFLAMVVAVWWYGEVRHADGQAEVRQEWDAAIARGRDALETLKAGQAKVTVRTETVYLDKIKVIHDKGATIVQRIPALVPADACLLPAGFRVLHDAAAQGAIPDPVARVDAGTGTPETVAWRPWNSRAGAGSGADPGRELHPVPPGRRTATHLAAMGAGTGGPGQP